MAEFQLPEGGEVTVQPMRETKFAYSYDDAPDMLVARDFVYRDPRGILLRVQVGKDRALIRFEDRETAYKAYRRLRRLGAEYLPLDDEFSRSWWISAPVKTLQERRNAGGES